MYQAVNVSEATTLVETGPIKVYCFVITDDSFLQIENCGKKHVYICEGPEGKEFYKY